MNDTDRAFRDIANEMMSGEANDLLEKQMARVLKWRQRQKAANEPADLLALIRQIQNEPNKRGPVMAAYAAAMWRLLEQEGRV
jgi:thymidylate synthase